MKILIADDDPVSLRIMQRTLEKSGYEVMTADNGRKAAAALSKDDGPRLALIDWMMPELDGPAPFAEKYWSCGRMKPMSTLNASYFEAAD